MAGRVRQAPAGSGFNPGDPGLRRVLPRASPRSARAPERMTFPLPDELSFEQGAARPRQLPDRRLRADQRVGFSRRRESVGAGGVGGRSRHRRDPGGEGTGGEPRDRSGVHGRQSGTRAAGRGRRRFPGRAGLARARGGRVRRAAAPTWSTIRWGWLLLRRRGAVSGAGRPAARHRICRPRHSDGEGQSPAAAQRERRGRGLGRVGGAGPNLPVGVGKEIDLVPFGRAPSVP